MANDPNRGNINPSESERRPSGSAGSPSAEGGGDLRFRCADVGYKDCPWETRARSENEILDRASEHGRQQHGLKEFTNEVRDRVRNAIRRAA